MKNRALPFLLSLALILSFSLGFAKAETVLESGSCGNNLTYVLYSNGLLSISGTGDMTDYPDWDTYRSSIPWGSDLTRIHRVVIAEGVTSIGDYAFSNCKEMTKITIPDGITKIGSRAFDMCLWLQNVTIPDSVITLGRDAFSRCRNLERVHILGGITSIGPGAFQNCPKLESISLPRSLTSIGNGAFATAYAYQDDRNSLEHVYYEGTPDEWDAISIGSGNSFLKSANIHYNSSLKDVLTESEKDSPASVPATPQTEQPSAPVSETRELFISGSKGEPKLTKEQISELLINTPAKIPDGLSVFDKTPLETAPYDAGALNKQVALQAADRLNMMRKIAGVPSVSLSDEKNNMAQHGAVLLAASEFTHNPQQPADMDRSFYNLGRKATSEGNISAGVGLFGSIDSFMDDTDRNNISTLGHRWWQLNPQIESVGFGASTGERFIVEMIHDASATHVDYDFISWPASGFFPNELFSNNTAWSILLNPDVFASPSVNDLTVMLTRASDGKQWEFSSNDSQEYAKIDGAKYFTVSPNTNHIIFRPDGISNYTGDYTVKIAGLKDSSEKDIRISYQVTFFDTPSSAFAGGSVTSDPINTPTDSTPVEDSVFEDTALSEVVRTDSSLFTDVPAGTWYADGISYVVKKGIMTGIGNSRFAPNDATTRAMVVTILYRMEGEPYTSKAAGFSDVSSGAWYKNAVNWAAAAGIVKGTSSSTFSPNDSITREQLTTMLYRYAAKSGYNLSHEGALVLTGCPDGNQVSAYAHDAMTWAYARGIINGTDNNMILPRGTATRAQLATILLRFDLSMAPSAA